MADQFVHLRVASGYSMQYGASHPSDLVARAAELGMSVALIEKEKLGGTCLHWGCVPAKTLLHAAEVADDLVERMPVITLAELKKDDWVGAVVGRIDASGKAAAFNILAGIEAFASRANRSGGVDVGMPAGLLDGALGVP